MPRAHLSKRLSDAEAIRLFAEYHIAQVRRRRNGEIVAVKHVQFGWISKERYYQLQKLHDLMPLVQEFIRGGYQAKAWLWSVNVDVFGITVPVGTALPIIETWNLYAELTRTKEKLIWHPETVEHPGPSGRMQRHEGYWEHTGIQEPDIRWDEVFIRAYALLGPFGDVIQILDSALKLPGTATPNAFQPATLIPGFIDFFRGLLSKGIPPPGGPIAPPPSP